MLTAPRQNWALYRAMSAEADAAWVRGLTISQRFAIYRDWFNAIWKARASGADWQHLEALRWQEKIAVRRRLVEAFKQLDLRVHG